MDDSTPVGFNRRDAVRIENTVLDYEHRIIDSRTPRKQRQYFQDDACDCCPPCCGTLWYIVNDEIVWTADHFEGLTDYDLTHYWVIGTTDPGVWPWANSCDTDSNGNVYQGGLPSRKCEPILTRPQSPMYILRSYDSSGNLQWSWSDYPVGYSAGGLRQPPNPISRVRCGGAHVFTTQAGYDTGSHVWLRRHDPADGSVIWSVDISQMWTDNATFGDVNLQFTVVNANADSVFVAASISGDSYTAIMTLDHDGNLLGTNRLTAHRASACWMDTDGTVYVSTGASPDAFSRMVGVYDNSCGFLTSVATISDTGFSVTSLRVSGGVLTAGNGTYIRTYVAGGSGAYTHTTTTGEKVMMSNAADVGSKSDDIARIRDSDLTQRVFLTPQMASDSANYTDAMPFSGGSVWCGRRWCGKTIEPDVDTPTTTSTTTTSTSTTTGSTTTASTTSTTTASTTTSSTTTASTTTGSTTTGSTSSTTAACSGNCNYIGHGTGTGSPTGFYWSFSGSGCSESCGPCFSGDAAALAEFIGRWPATYDDFVSVACT